MTAHADRATLSEMKNNFAVTAYHYLRELPPWDNGTGSNVIHERILPFATYAPWLSDAEFIDLFNRILKNTLVDKYRCFELWSLGKQMQGVEGDVLEVGVWRGGTGVVLAKSLAGSGKKVYLADTFTGVVKTGAQDTLYKGGEHADTSRPLVEALIKACELDNTVILQGIFPEDTGHQVTGKLAMLHCDVDVYLSAKDVVEWTLPRLSPGGVIVFDDYGFSGCEGVTRLVNEYRDRPEFVFFYNLNGHGILYKK
jgi:O-methyltransferase